MLQRKENHRKLQKIMHQFIFLNVFSGVKMFIQSSDPNDLRNCHTSYFIIFRVFYFVIGVEFFTCKFSCLYTKCMPHNCGGQVFKNLQNRSFGRLGAGLTCKRTFPSALGIHHGSFVCTNTLNF